ncbi:MAG: hypothetical protein QNJ71_06920 [Acidimicrobiia bacterium]|nr:hypothetical protein [Acidimicrobiia bacterium]
MQLEDKQLVQDILKYPGDDVVTLYLPVDPADPRNQRPAGSEWWRSKAKEMINDLPVGEDRESRLGFREVVARLEEFAETYVPDERSLAIYATVDDVFTIPLQVDLEPEAAIGEPAVGPLVKALTTYRHYLIVLVAADEIRAVEAHLGEVEDRGMLRLAGNWAMPGATRSGHRFRYEAREEKYQKKYHQNVATELDRLILSGEFDRLVLGGSEREAHGVFAAMNEHAAGRVAGIAPIPLTADHNEIAERAGALAEAFENAEEESLVRRVLSQAGAGGAAAVGKPTVGRALDMFAVRRLAVAQGALAVDEREHMLRQAYAQGASVQAIVGPARELLSDHDGVGAELYYPL